MSLQRSGCGLAVERHRTVGILTLRDGRPYVSQPTEGARIQV